MNYLQKEIGGKLRGLKFNQDCLMTFYSEVDQKRTSTTSKIALLFAALQANSYVKKEEFIEKITKEIDGKEVEEFVPITKEMVSDWADEMSEEDHFEIMQTFMASKPYVKIIEDNKKKSEQISTEPNMSGNVIESPAD